MLSYRSLVSTMILLSCFLLIILGQGVKPNICGFIYCENDGSCGQTNQTLLGFQCQCQFGFTGLLCESKLNVTTCGRNPCLNNGTCSIMANYSIKCTCPATYTGDYCATKIK